MPDVSALLPIAAIVILVASAVIASLTCLHMMQLSSYQTPAYWLWLKRNAGDYFVGFWPCAVIAMLGLLEHWLALLFACLLLLYMMIKNRPKKHAKKPLVYTPRAIRLLVMQSILLIAAGIGVYQLIPYQRFFMVGIAAVYFLVPFLMIAANWLTFPVQSVVNKGFVKDAERRLTSQPNLTIIGITGSYGKTSMKFILTRLLSVRYETLMTPESYNTTMGVVRTIREQLQPTHEVFVCEMGARHLGDVKEICDFVHPTMGILTSVGEQHLDTFGSLENVTKAKYELIDAITGTAFLNLDSDPIRQQPRPAKAVTYALNHPADYTVTALSASRKGSTFTVQTPQGDTQEFATTLLGSHNVLNILGAIGVAHTMGIPLEKMVGAVRGLPQVPHRLQLLQMGRLTVIDDAYNANPHGVKAALDTLALFEGSKILITPGMIELGDKEDACNHAFGVQAAAICQHVILVGQRQTASIAEGLKEAGFTAVMVADTVEEAMRMAEQLPDKHKVVLLSNDLPDNYAGR